MLQNTETVTEKSHYIKLLLYGPTGSGKTRFCADAPKPLWFDFEDSSETLSHWAEYSDIPRIVPNNPTHLVQLVDRAIRDLDVETIVIDSISTGLEYYLRTYMDEVALGKHGRARDKFVPFEADYKYSTNVFSDLFGKLQRAPINVAIIGHERYILDDEGKLIKIVPDVTPKLQRVVRQLVNVVGYLKLKPSNDPERRERELFVNPTSLIEAKNRLNIQATFIKSPTWKEVFGD